jgi:hypothetical protein
MYEEDIDAFTKSLRNFEKNLKLFENIWETQIIYI